MGSLAVGEEIPDADLVAAAQGGDAGAFEVLFERYRDKVERICAYRLEQRHADLDDAVQQTMVKCWRGLASFEGGSEFAHWLARIARNTAIDVARARARRAEQPIPVGVGVGRDIAADVTLSVSVTERLRQARARDVEMLVDHHVHGMPVAVLADRYGMTPAALAVALHRARQRLRALLSSLHGLVPVVWLSRFRWPQWRQRWAVAGPSVHEGLLALAQSVTVLVVVPALATPAVQQVGDVTTTTLYQPALGVDGSDPTGPPRDPPARLPQPAAAAPPPPSPRPDQPGTAPGSAPPLHAPEPIAPDHGIPVPGTDRTLTTRHPAEAPDYAYGVRAEPVDEPIVEKSTNDPTTAPADEVACQAATQTPVTYCERGAS